MREGYANVRRRKNWLRASGKFRSFESCFGGLWRGLNRLESRDFAYEHMIDQEMKKPVLRISQDLLIMILRILEVVVSLQILSMCRRSHHRSRESHTDMLHSSTCTCTALRALSSRYPCPISNRRSINNTIECRIIFQTLNFGA